MHRNICREFRWEPVSGGGDAGHRQEQQGLPQSVHLQRRCNALHAVWPPKCIIRIWKHFRPDPRHDQMLSAYSAYLIENLHPGTWFSINLTSMKALND